MITARQSRAARALLGWTQETLADKARVSLTALKRLESESGLEVYETRAIRSVGLSKQPVSSSCRPSVDTECCWSMMVVTKSADGQAADAVFPQGDILPKHTILEYLVLPRVLQWAARTRQLTCPR